jgi:hypothetical protein
MPDLRPPAHLFDMSGFKGTFRVRRLLGWIQGHVIIKDVSNKS